MTVAAVILAAGAATRFGMDKRSVVADGELPMLHRVLAVFTAVGLPTYVVIPPDDAFGLSACARYAATPIINPRHREGMGSSLATGIAVVSELEDIKGVVIGLADMPWVTPTVVLDLIDALLAANKPVVPTFRGLPGHPRVVPASKFPVLMGLHGDAGARDAIDWDAAIKLSVSCEGILRDVDVPADLLVAPTSTAAS